MSDTLEDYYEKHNYKLPTKPIPEETLEEAQKRHQKQIREEVERIEKAKKELEDES